MDHIKCEKWYHYKTFIPSGMLFPLRNIFTFLTICALGDWLSVQWPHPHSHPTYNSPHFHLSRVPSQGIWLCLVQNIPQLILIILYPLFYLLALVHIFSQTHEITRFTYFLLQTYSLYSTFSFHSLSIVHQFPVFQILSYVSLFFLFFLLAC